MDHPPQKQTGLCKK